MEHLLQRLCGVDALAYGHNGKMFVRATRGWKCLQTCGV